MHIERKNLKKRNDELFTFDFFGFGENIWKILSAQYVVDQLKRFGKMQLKQDTEWDVGKVTIKQVTKLGFQNSTPQFLYQVKNLNSKSYLSKIPPKWNLSYSIKKGTCTNYKTKLICW